MRTCFPPVEIDANFHLSLAKQPSESNPVAFSPASDTSLRYASSSADTEVVVGVVLLADVEVEEVVVADVALVLVDVATLVDVAGTATGAGGAAAWVRCCINNTTTTAAKATMVRIRKIITAMSTPRPRRFFFGEGGGVGGATGSTGVVGSGGGCDCCDC